MNKWNKKNALRVLLYAVLYAVAIVIVCVTGSFHPVFFICYQITAGILLSGITITAFRRVQAPGVATCLVLAVLLVLLVIQDAVAWHVIPLIVIAIFAEAFRAAFKYNWTGDVISTVIMSFSTFEYYGQIWFNRTYTTGYADTLMAMSPPWSLFVVIVVGIILSIAVSNLTAKLFKLER